MGTRRPRLRAREHREGLPRPARGGALRPRGLLRRVRRLSVRYVCGRFDDLSVRQIYDALQLRAEVFVVEQRCAYLDPDGADESSTHLLGYEVDQLVSYSRWFETEDGIKLGRIVTSPSVRGHGLGKDLMRASLARIGDGRIHMNAQTYLQRFYESFGFVREGAEFPEDGIPHVYMVRE